MPKNSAGYRLFKLTGLPYRRDYLRAFDRANLFPEYPGTKWPAVDARVAAGAIRFLLRKRLAIFVGRRVSAAFGYGDLEWCKAQYDTDWQMGVVCIPHPSGRNLWYNDAENSDKVRALFDGILRTVK